VDDIEYLGDDLEAAEGRHEIGTGVAAPYLVDERLRRPIPARSVRSPASRSRTRNASGMVMPGTSLCRNSACG
jgi:hypothetical protein